MAASAVSLALIALSACGGHAATPTEPSANSSPGVAGYLDQLVTVMQARSINRESIDWQRFRETVRAEAASAHTIAAAHPAIRAALGLLGDNHSFYVSATGTTITNSTKRCTGDPFDPPLLPDGIGYVRVTAFSGSTSLAARFTQSLHQTIALADRPGLIGWIVDVRGNSGGNMWPMLAGVGPLLDEGTLGFFVDPAGAEAMWEYRSGASILSGSALQTVAMPHQLIRDHPKVAVLTDGGVASSGEAVVVAFRHRPNTRSFGSPTCGLSTANATIPLSDGATLYLTVSVMADRTKARYGDMILPDEVIADPVEAVRRAVAWLQSGT